MQSLFNYTIYLWLTGLLFTYTSAEDDNSNDPYELTIIDIGTHWLKINWSDPIPINTFQVIAEEDGDDGRVIRSTYSIFGTPKSSHEYEFDFLTPYTNYTLSVIPQTSDPSVKPKESVRAATLEYTPGKVGIKALIFSYNFITLQWYEPEEPNGVIEAYYISINTHEIIFNTTVNGSVHIITVRDEIKPYTTYAFNIAAKTSYGWGETYSDVLTTLVTFPYGAPANFTHSDDVTSYSAELYWNEIPADQRNGEIEGYRLRYTDRGKEHEVYTESREYRFDNLTENTRFTFYLSGYVLNNSGKRLLGLETSLVLNTLPSAQVPPVSEQLRNDWLIKKFTTSDEVAFTLTGNVLEIFPQENGEITQYQILVMKGDSNEEFRKSGYTENMVGPLTWNQAKYKSFNEPYAIGLPQPSPSSWLASARSKRATSEPTEITIGSETCDSWTQYCNGPLQALKTYCVYARGWAKNDFYTDSDCLVVTTTKYNQTALIVGIIVTVVVLSLVVGVVIFCIRKRRKTEGQQTKPRLRKDVTPLPKTPAQKGGQETYEYVETNDLHSSYIDLENVYCDTDDVTSKRNTEENGYVLDATISHD